MADSSDLAKLGTPEEAAPTALNLVRAVVHSTEGATLKVIVPSFDEQRLYEIENKDWRADSGDEVLIALDDDDQPWLAIPGWPFRGGGLLAAVRPDFEPPNPEDVVVGDGIWGVEPGADGNLAMRWALRVGTWFMNSKSLRSRFQSMIASLEQDDPAEVWLQRMPGVNKAVPTGSGIYDRKHPVGKSTVVAVDAAPGASTLYIVDGGYGIPGAWDTADVLDSLGVPSVEYLIDDEWSIEWASKTSLVATLSGDAAIGDTELRIAEPTLQLPSAGKAFMSRGGVLPQWTGRELVLDANANGLTKAGATALPLKNITPQEAADLDPAGVFRVAAGITGADIRRWRYESFTYDPGTQEATFTLPPTECNRNVLDNASVTIAKLTGVTSEFQMMTLGDRQAGDTTLRLKFNHKHGDPAIPPTQELIDKILPSGMVRFEVEDRDPAGPGKRDYPVVRRAYTNFNRLTGEITVPAGLPERVPDDSWVWIEGCSGMMREHLNGTQIRMGRLNGVTGLDDGASVNETAQWSPRYRNPGTPGSIGFLAGVLGGVGGLVNKNAQIAIRALDNAIKAKQRGGEVDVMIVVPGQGYRKPVAAWRSAGLGLLGGGLTGASGIAHRLHVADWGCRTKPPGLEFECDPDDPDCDPDDPGGGGGGELGSATLGVDHVEGALPAARIVLPGYNRETGEVEEIELDYTDTDVDADDQATLTGVTLASETGFALGDYFFDAGSLVRYADSVISSALGIETNATFSRGKASEVEVGNAIVESGVPRPGLRLGSGNEPFFARGDGKARFGASGDALATEAYVDLLAQGMRMKTPSARVATTENISLANLQTIDGVALSAGDRVLVKDQTDATQNGIYVVAAGSSWTRATDADTAIELEFAAIFTQEGGQASTLWFQTAQDIVLGTTEIAWTDLFSLDNFVAGEGLIRVGNLLEVGEGEGIQVDADSVTAKLDGATLTKSASGLKVTDDTFAAAEHADEHLLAGSDPLDPSDWNLAGTHAARPAAGTAGRTYFETDTHVLYRDTGAAWQAISPGFVRKTADQTLAQSSTTLQDVTDLTFPVEIGEIWLVEAFLMVQANATADWKFGWGGTATYGMRWGVHASTALATTNLTAVDTAATALSLGSVAATAALGGGAGTFPVVVKGRVGAVTVAGTVQLRAAQNTATAIDNIIRGGTAAEDAGSQMTLTRIN